jgi:ComF family protein
MNTALGLPYCQRCGRTLPPPALHDDGCARCKSEPYWNVAGVARVGTYPSALRALLVGLKYHGRERNASYLADLLAATLRQHGWFEKIDAFIPVPMHWLRRLQRPCDHARVLAEALGQRMKVPVLRLVRRARNSPSQTGIASKTARFENVKGCFALPRKYWPPGPRPVVAGKTVCIVDNLMMTGATVTEVSKVLRRAGAKRIYAAVIARPASPGDPQPSVLQCSLR